MSQSPERSAEAAAELGPQSAAPLDVSRDIRDELADHLATDAEATVRREGISAQEALQQAAARFGKVGRVAWRCWWIQRGDWVMGRALKIGGLVVLVAVAAGFIMPALAQLQKLSGKVDDLDAELKSLNATQKALLDQQKTSLKSLSIEGKAYIGKPTVPAAGATIEVWRASDTSKVRTLKCDAAGRFRTAHLPRDEYFLIAPLVGEENLWVGDDVKLPNGRTVQERTWCFNVQSRPLFETDSGPVAKVDLDVRFPKGEITFELEQKLPDTITGEHFKWTTVPTVLLFARPLDLVALPGGDTRNPASDWPALGFRGGWNGSVSLPPSLLSDGRVGRFSFYQPEKNEASHFGLSRGAFSSGYALNEQGESMVLGPSSVLPPGRYQVAAALVLLPERFFEAGKPRDDGRIQRLSQGNPSGGYYGGSANHFAGTNAQIPQDLASEVVDWAGPAELVEKRLTRWLDVEVREGKRTHLRIELSNAEKLVENIQQVLDNPAPTADDMRRAFGISQKPLTLVGHLPRLPSEPEKQ
jgi:hypothetical protein